MAGIKHCGGTGSAPRVSMRPCAIPSVHQPTFAAGRRATAAAPAPQPAAAALWQSSKQRQSMCMCLASDMSLSRPSTLVAEIQSLPASEVADTIWGLLLARGYDPATFATVADCILQQPDRFDTGSLVSILSAMTEAGHQDRELLEFATAILSAPEHVSSTSAATLAQAAYIFAILCKAGSASIGPAAAADVVDVSPALSAIIMQARSQVGDFSPEDLVRLLGAVAEMRAEGAAGLLEASVPRLVGTLIPLAQLPPDSLAQVLLAYARLGIHQPRLCDMALQELTRKAGELSLDAVSKAVWAVATLCEGGKKQWSQSDSAFVAAMAQRTSQVVSTQSTWSAGVASTFVHLLLAFSMLAGQGRAEVNRGVQQLVKSSVPALTQQCRSLPAQDLVVLAYVLTGLQVSSQPLMTALGDAALHKLDEMDGDDLVHLASLGPATGTHHDRLVSGIIQQAISRAGADAPEGRRLPLATLLELARVVAVIQQHNSSAATNSPSLQDLLKAVNQAQQAQDLDDMSTHCGATDPVGLQK